MIMQGVTFNTTMALVAGTIMILAVVFARTAARAQAAVPGKARTLTGWGWAFVALGAYLGVTGMYMTLMWPLKEVDGAFCCTVDNVTFGEPAALYGLLTFIAPFAPENKWVGRIATLLTWGCGVTWVFLSFTVFYSHVGFFPPA